MVRIASKMFHRRIQKKKQSTPQPIEPDLHPIDQSSSKILHVVRQALLNAAEELVSQQQNPSNHLIPFPALDIINHDFNQSHQQNENATKTKTIKRKTKKNSKGNYRRQ